jgi:thiamine biosynthesis lipoprotein
MPLVNAWGFGYKGREITVDSMQIDSIKQYVGYKNILLSNNSVYKTLDNCMLDFSAIAKGYAVDEVSALLNKLSIQQYVVEIGGEVYASGKKINGEEWSVGIEKPTFEENLTKSISYAIPLYNKAIATSGNYRNWNPYQGKKIGHEINPHTGYPIETDIISASVIANDCMSADAYATAFMVLGSEVSIDFLTKHPELEAILILYKNDSVLTWKSNTLKHLKIN